MKNLTLIAVTLVLSLGAFADEGHVAQGGAAAPVAVEGGTKEGEVAATEKKVAAKPKVEAKKTAPVKPKK